MASNDAATHETRLESLRLENMERCFVFLRNSGTSTVADIAEATGLSRPTVRDRLNDLTDTGLVSEVDRVVRRGQSSGRPASRYAVAAEAGFVVGVELGKHQERLMISDLTGRIHVRHTFPADHRQNVTHRMRSLTEHVNDLRIRHSKLGPLLGLGAAVPGSLSTDGKMVLSPIFPEWAGQNIRGVFEEHFDVPVTLQNDLNAAAIAEHRQGAAADVDDVVLALVWHQIAVGIIVNGKLHSGKNSLAGEISRLKSTARPDFLDRWPSTPELMTTVAEAEAGSSDAAGSLQEFADIAGDQIAAALLTIDPAIVVLYGPATTNDLLVNLVSNAVTSSIDPKLNTPIVRAALGEDAAVYGVLLAALDDVHLRVFGDAAKPTHRLIDQTT